MTYEDVMALTAMGMCASIVLCSKFSVLLSNVININRCNLCKQKLFEVFSNF